MTTLKRKMSVIEPETTPNSTLTFCNRVNLQSTTVYFLDPQWSSSSTGRPWIAATVNGRISHPLSSKLTLYNSLPLNFNPSKLYSKTLAVSHNTSSSYHKLLVVPTRSHKYANILDYINTIEYHLNDCTLLALCHRGQLWCYFPNGVRWLNVTIDWFDDIAIYKGDVYAVDRDGMLYLVTISPEIRKVSIGKTLTNEPVATAWRWRKRLVVWESELYLVVRFEDNVFTLYSCWSAQQIGSWSKCLGLGKKVLFVAKYYCFFIKGKKFPGNEFEDCIVFSEWAFPVYENGCWELSRSGSGDDIAVFRFKDGTFATDGENIKFPKIDWSPPAWVYDAWSDKPAESLSHLSSESERKHDEDRDLRSDAEDSNSKDENNGEMQSDSDNQEVTQSPLGTPIKNLTQLVPNACASARTKSHKSDSGTAKFESFDVRSDLVPTLQKIWLKNGNVVENCIIRSSEIVARALESLATMVRILEDNSARSLNGCHSDYLSSTLSDLKVICFKVDWLIPPVEKAVQLHKSKPLFESLNNLSELSSKVKERMAILSDGLAKLDNEENKLKKEIGTVSKMVSVYGIDKFNEPLGLGMI